MTESARTRIAPLRTQARAALERARGSAVASGALPEAAAAPEAPPIEIERPADPRFGDLSSNLAMKMARPCRMAPLAIANAIAAELEREIAKDPRSTPLARAEVAPPGFINLTLSDHALETVIDGVLDSPGEWGRVEPVRPRSVNVEFVSANPTGPLTIGNARGAFIGDLLSRVLEAGGQRVTREYYFNDAGGQLDNLGASVLAIRRGQPVPDDGYHGAYVDELAAAVPDAVWSEAIADEANAPFTLGRWAGARVREGIESSLDRLGVHFDVWTTETSLHDAGWVERAIERLRDHGHLYEQDGALWFRSTTFGDDKDRVIIRSNGQPTYFAADLGYVTEKFSRGFDHLIYVWGADHHGTVARVRNAAEAMGFDRDAVQMLLYSWVRFVRDGEEIAMSKRSGDFVTLDELLAEVGTDAARWYFASRSNTSAIDFDIDHMRELRERVEKRRDRERGREDGKSEGVDLGVYLVQYAHARIASIVRKATEAGLAPASSIAGALIGEPELLLARAVIQFPEVVEDAVWAEETVSITTYTYDLAQQFNAFYRDARVVDADEPERSAKRLALAEATRVTLANALGLLGISAPQSM